MKKIILPVILSFFMTVDATLSNEVEKITIGTFTHAEISQWKERSFKKHTTYQLVGEETPLTMQATCEDQASIFYRRVSIDLKETPMMHWSWRVDGVNPSLDERTKDGDDYPARIYVVNRGSSILPWRTKALSYVWSNNQAVGTSWTNAYTDQGLMIAAQSGQPENAEIWINEVRNVREDFKNLFGQDITSIDSVAIMTDCDNSKLSATGYYRNIWFSSD